jgi:hypothetical protein
MMILASFDTLYEDRCVLGLNQKRKLYVVSRIVTMTRRNKCKIN